MRGLHGNDWSIEEKAARAALPPGLVPLLAPGDGEALEPRESALTRAEVVPYLAEGDQVCAQGDLRDLQNLVDCPRADALAALAAAAGALAALHYDGRVHGDLRPESIGVGAERSVLLAPARAVDAAALLRARLVAGAEPDAVAFASPEVVAGQAATKASDVYSLAAIIYRVLGGRPPLGRLAVGLLVRDLGSGFPSALSHGLHSDPAERGTAAELAEVLREAAKLAAELDAFQLVEDDADAPEAVRLTEEEVELREEEHRKGSQVSALLVLVLVVGGFFVFFGALALVVAGWSAIGKVGQFIVLGMFTGGVWGLGAFLERRKYHRSGFTLILLGTQLLWVNMTHLLFLTDMEEEPGAWAVGSTALTALGFLMAARRRSVTYGWLSAFGFVVAASTFGAAISTGSRYGFMVYSALVGLAYAGVSFLGHKTTPRPAILGLPFAVGAALWCWTSCATSLALLEMHHEVIALIWPYLLTGVFLGATFLLKGPYRIVALAGGASFVLVAPTAQAFVNEDLPFLMWAVMLGLGILAAAFKVKPIAKSLAIQVVTVLLGLVNVLFAPGIRCLEKCMDRDGLQMLTDALKTVGQVHESRFVYLSIPLGTAMGLVAMGYLFSRGATRKTSYRILEVAGLLNFFGLLTLLSLPDVADEFFFIGVLMLGGSIVMGLGVWGRRAMLVGIASAALLLNLVIQYFAKLSALGAHTGLLAVGFGVGLLGMAVLWERKVKGLLPKLKSWA